MCGVPTPALLLPTPEQTQSLERLQDALDRAEAALVATAIEREPIFRAWLAGAPDAEPGLPGRVGVFPLDAIGPEHRLPNSAAL